jgi:hypothetical protein
VSSVVAGELVTELEPGLTMEVELACIERDKQADLGLRLAEARQLTAALQAEMVPAKVTIVGDLRRSCVACGCESKAAHDEPFGIDDSGSTIGSESRSQLEQRAGRRRLKLGLLSRVPLMATTRFCEGNPIGRRE